MEEWRVSIAVSHTLVSSPCLRSLTLARARPGSPRFGFVLDVKACCLSDQLSDPCAPLVNRDGAALLGGGQRAVCS